VRIELTSDETPVRHDPDRPPRWIAVAVAGGVLAGAALLASWAGVPPALAAGAALIPVAGIWFRAYAWHSRLRSVRRRSPVVRHWVITEDEIRVEQDGSAWAWRWPIVATVYERRDAYVLYRDGGGAGLDIPRAALTASQDGELRALLARRGQMIRSAEAIQRPR
jgi:YcxB-like protein